VHAGQSARCELLSRLGAVPSGLDGGDDDALGVGCEPGEATYDGVVYRGSSTTGAVRRTGPRSAWVAHGAVSRTAGGSFGKARAGRSMQPAAAGLAAGAGSGR
jgi:hypothetical protein